VCVTMCRWVAADRVDYDAAWGLYRVLTQLASTSGATMAICDAATVRYSLQYLRTLSQMLTCRNEMHPSRNEGALLLTRVHCCDSAGNAAHFSLYGACAQFYCGCCCVGAAISAAFPGGVAAADHASHGGVSGHLSPGGRVPCGLQQGAQSQHRYDRTNPGKPLDCDLSQQVTDTTSTSLRGRWSVHSECTGS